MNRLSFLKRLIGGVVAAPIVAKALTEEKAAPLALPSFQLFGLSATSFPVCTQPVMTGPGDWYVVSPKKQIFVGSMKPKRRRKRK